jgi:putative membrane fusion protein
VLQKIEDIDSKISSIRNNVNNNSIFSSDLQKIDNQIEKKIELIKNRIDNKDYGSIKNIKEDINKLIEKKIIISGKDSVGVYNLSDLIDEKEEYEKIIADNQINVKSDISGIVSYHIDGYEQFLKPENIGSFTLDEFKRLDNLELDENISSTSGQAVAKIIDNFEWYIGFVEDAELLYNIREGNFIDVRFTGIDDEIIKGEVLRVSENENDEKLVIVKFNNYIDSFYNIRKENIDVIVKTYSGYKIPTSAIRMINNKIGIFVTRDSVARFCEVEILSKNNDFAIIKENENGDTDGVLLYDEIIIKGKDIYDGKLIR